MMLQMKSLDFEKVFPFLNKNQIGAVTTVLAGFGVFFLYKKFVGYDSDVQKGKPIKNQKSTRKNQVVGLQNVGNSCFLNSLIQCLAALNELCSWLEVVSLKCPEATLPIQLLQIIRAVNGDRDDLLVESVDPSPVLHAMRRHGWIIRSSEEQDCHELFHVLFSTVEEEIIGSCKSNIEELTESFDDNEESLDDISLNNEEVLENMDEIAVAGNSDVDLEALAAVSSTSSCVDSEERSSKDDRAIGEGTSSLSGEVDCDSGCGSNEEMDDESKVDSGFSKLPNVSRVCSYGRRTNATTSSSGTIYAMQGMLNRQKVPHSPFKGGVVSQRTCLQCGFKTPLRYDAFESLSLPLLDNFSLLNPLMPRTNLQQLLNSYFEPESVSGADCEGCKDKPVTNLIGKSSVKRQYITKLPKCLCLHIQRNFWTEYGTLAKRMDFVEFPEYLNMGSYTLASEISKFQVPSNETRSKLYRLVSVAVHSGDAFSGHFFTYRLGPGSVNRRWYFTSDTSVRKASLVDVLNCSAYMLFYERI